MDEMGSPALKTSDQKSANNKTIIGSLAVLLVIAMLVIGWLGWQLMDSNKQISNLKSSNQQLQGRVLDLTQQLAIANGTFVPDGAACNPAVTTELQANILAALNSGNYAALEGSMTDSVNVIIAASEGIGPQTPAQAITSMAYFNGGATPWTVVSDSATIATYEAGFYIDYFDDNTYIARSANGMVAVFDFDECGQINEVFMVANEELLL